MYRCNQHDDTRHLLAKQIQAYLRAHPIARLRQAPFSMRLNGQLYGPDVQIIKNNNPYFTARGMLGPADICIEIVCERSASADHGSKVDLYEGAGVREYWIIDIRRRETRFFRLNKLGQYVAQILDSNHRYLSPLLPGFHLYVPMLWHVALFSDHAESNAPAPQNSQLSMFQL